MAAEREPEPARWGMLQRGELMVGVMHHPDRKAPAVVVLRGSVLHTVAYCRSDEEADRLWTALDELVNGARRGF